MHADGLGPDGFGGDAVEVGQSLLAVIGAVSADHAAGRGGFISHGGAPAENEYISFYKIGAPHAKVMGTPIAASCFRESLKLLKPTRTRA